MKILLLYFLISFLSHSVGSQSVAVKYIIRNDARNRTVTIVLDLTATEKNVTLYDVACGIDYFDKINNKVKSEYLSLTDNGLNQFEPSRIYQKTYPYENPRIAYAKGTKVKYRVQVKGGTASGDSLKRGSFEDYCLDNDVQDKVNNLNSPFKLGSATLGFAQASPLLNSEKLLTGLTNRIFLTSVGGVSFDKTAEPDTALRVKALQLKYDPSKPDGQRLTAVINEKNMKIHIYDWELMPIARYANSQYYACFTLFGNLKDKSQQDSILENYGRILNYHPEFVNTLIGLRLFQLDILIIEPDLTVHLPKISGKYILGNGEKVPNVKANLTGWSRFEKFFVTNYDKYQSYLICDENRKIVFSISRDSLKISGEPFYHFWKSGLKEEVIYLKEFSELMSSNTSLFKNINPEVWNAGVKTMRFSAFFRYCKKYFPDNWDIFINSISDVKIKPQVTTPATLTFY